MLRSQDSSQLSHPLLSQPICSALQIALVDLLASWAVVPDSVTGHSSGEIAAAYAVGALNMKDAMSIAYHRGVVAGKLSESGNVNGAMLAVGMPANDIQPYLDALSLGKVVVACKNSPSSLTISGDLAAVKELEEILLQKQVFCRRLAIDVAYHSHHMRSVSDEYYAAIAHIKAGAGDTSYHQNVSFFSSVTGTEVTATELGPRYWVKNLLNQVKFDESLQTLCFATNSQKHVPGASSGKKAKRAGAARKVSVDYLVEIGPHSALAGPIKEIIKADGKLRGAEIMYGSVLTRRSDAVSTALTLASSLASSGCNLAFDAVNRPTGSLSKKPQLLVDLPPYAWNHSKSYWAEPRVSKIYRQRKYPRTDLLGVSDHISCPFEPRWRNFIRVSEIPWLGDHRIQSNMVYPAAGYIVMAIEASSQLAAEDSSAKVAGFHLRSVSILSALIIDDGSAVETMVSLKACESRQLDTVDREYEFHIYSATEENRWTEHCKGIVGVQLAGLGDSGEPSFGMVDDINNPDRAATKDVSVLDTEKFYESLEQIGLEYGPSFANMITAHFTDDTCFAEVVIPDTAAIMPMRFQYPFVIHPCILDSTLHAIFVPVLAKMSRGEGPPVPVFIDQIYVSRAVNSVPGEKMDVQASITEDDGRDIGASLAVMDRNSSDNGPAVSITGLKCRRIANGATEATANPVERIAYNFKWEADPDLLTRDGLNKLLSESAPESSPARDSDLHEGAALYYVEEALKSIGTIDPATLPPHLQRLWSLFSNAVRGKPTGATSASPGKGVDLERVRKTGPKGELLCALGERLPGIMKNAIDIFKDHDLNELWGNAFRLHGCKPAARYLDMVSHKNPNVSVLEVGAGADAPSTIFLQQLAAESGDIPRCTEYTCTHPDSSVLETAAKRLDRWQKWTNFKTLDIERNLEDQGFGRHGYDVVILPCGFVAVASRNQALKNVHKLLRPNGHLVVVEPIPCDSLADNVIFGHFPGWWSGDPDEAASFEISESKWHQALCKAQFSGIGAFVECNRGESEYASTLIISRPLTEFHPTHMSILVIAEEDDCGVSLSGLRDHLSRLSPKAEMSDLANANPAGRLCIVLSDLKTSVFAQADDQVLEKLKQIFLQSTGVLWVTRGGMVDVTNPDAGLAIGFARTARSESGASPILTLDLDGRNIVSGTRAAEIISDTVRCRFLGENVADNDVEYAEKDGILQIPRVVENIQLNQAIATLHDHQVLSEQDFHQQGRPLCAAANKKAESVYFADDTEITELADTSVAVEVRAACLSRDDKMGPRLCAGYSGIVYSVGKEVNDFAPGDRVAYLGSGSLTSVYHDQELAFQKVPANLSLEAAAALPAAYCSAFYVVNHLARVSSDDAVLVYGASGASGQALVELCFWKQARVFATVETAPQRSVLTSKYRIPGSRIFLNQDESFVKAMTDETGGKGVDIVINNQGPSSRLIKLSCKCMIPYGRYIDLGSEDAAEIPRLADGAVFSTFDLGNLCKRRPRIVGQVWEKVMRLFREGKLEGPSSMSTYSITDIIEALEAGSQAVGSVIITAGPGDTVKVSYLTVSRRF